MQRSTISPPTQPTIESEEFLQINDQMLARSLNVASLSMIAVLVLFRATFALFNAGDLIRDTNIVFLFLSGVGTQLFLRLNRTRAAAFVFLAVGMLGLFFISTSGELGRSYSVGGYMILMFFAIAILPGRWWLAVLFMSIILTGGSHYFSHLTAPANHGLLGEHIVSGSVQVAFLIMASTSVGLLYSRINRLLTSVQKANNSLEVANAALRKSHSHSQILMETAVDPFFLVTAEMKIVDVNERACDLFGYSREQFLQMHINEIEPEETQHKVHAAFAKMTRIGQFSALDARPITRDGRLISAEIRGQRVEFDNAELFYIVITDTTERVERDSQLEEQRERLQLINDNVPIRMAHFDTNLRMKYANAAVVNTHRMDEPEWMSLEDTVGMNYYQTIRPHFERALAGESTQYEEFNAGEGTTSIVQLVPHMIDGEVAGVFATGIDITARKAAEAELREAQQSLQLRNDIFNHVINNVPARITYLDRDENVIFVNDRVEEHLGISAEDATTQPLKHILPQAYWRKTQPYMKQAISSKKEVVFETPLVIADGSTIIERSYYFPHVVDGEVGAIFTMHVDVTEARSIEDSLAKAQKLESLGVLAGGIAHDFNNLLVAILGQSSLALAKMEETHKSRRHIVQAIGASKRAAALIQQMLAYSGRGSFVIGALNLNELIQNNLDLFAVSIPKNVQLVTTLNPTLPMIEADMAQMQQLIMNLIINAGQAIGSEQGHIKITTCVQEIEAESGDFWQITGDPLIPGDYVSIEIEDDGSGMDEKTISRIFDPFYTTKENGTGLGLAAVVGIIRGHKGGIRLHSEVGKGTVFHMMFPVLADDMKWKEELALSPESVAA